MRLDLARAVCADRVPANPLGYRRVVQRAENFANLAQRLGTALPNHPHRHVLCLHSSFAIKPLCRFAEQFHKSSAISIIMEDSLARVTPPAEMIDGIFKLYPQRPRHSFWVASQCQMFRFDPFFLLTPFPRFSIESRQSKTPEILAGNILQRFSDLLQRVASINAIPQTGVICVVAYLQAADWIGRLVS
jgi:hypothetical protein